MGLQETFDTVVNHLRKQGKPARYEDDCLYRAPGGLKCAAGCLILDEDYDPIFEGVSVHIIRYRTENSIHNKLHDLINSYGHDIRLVTRLQNIHDRWDESDGDFLEYCEKEWKEVATKFNLVYKPTTN